MTKYYCLAVRNIDLISGQAKELKEWREGVHSVSGFQFPSAVVFLSFSTVFPSIIHL